jgi:transposase
MSMTVSMRSEEAVRDVLLTTLAVECDPFSSLFTSGLLTLDALTRARHLGLDVHVVMDNYGTHKTKLIRNWFAKRPRWHVHYTPTAASWINQIERFFALLTERTLKRGVFQSVAALEAAINAYIEATNVDPRPFRWTRAADDILASIQ